MNLRPALRPDPDPRIGTCVAEFAVAGADGTLTSPDHLVGALRAEILPVLEQVLDQEPLRSAHADIEQLEIDLGHWPDPPDWIDLRRVFAQKLRAALAPYLHWPETVADTRGADRVLPALPAPGALESLSDPAFLAEIRAHLTQAPDHRESLKRALLGSPAKIDALLAQRGPELLMRLQELLGHRGENAPEKENPPADLWPLLQQSLAHITDRTRRAWLEAALDSSEATPARDWLEHLQNTVATAFLHRGLSVAEADSRAAGLTARLAASPALAVEALSAPPPDQLTRDIGHVLSGFGITGTSHARLRALHRDRPQEVLQRIIGLIPDERRDALMAVLTPDKLDEYPAGLGRQDRGRETGSGGRRADGGTSPDVARDATARPGFRTRRTPRALTKPAPADLSASSRQRLHLREPRGTISSAAPEDSAEQFLTDPTLTDQRLRQGWIENRAALHPAFTALAPDQLHRLIKLLLPSDAPLLAEKIDAVARRQTGAGLAQVLRDLLDARAIDFDTLATTQRATSTGPLALWAALSADPGIEAETLRQAWRAVSHDQATSPEALMAHWAERVVEQTKRLDDPGHGTIAPPPRFRSTRPHRLAAPSEADMLHLRAFATLGRSVLERLIETLLPQRADLLRDAIGKALETTPAPNHARALILHRLLEDQPVDLDDTLRRAAEFAETDPDSSHPDEDADDPNTAARHSLSDLLRTLGLSASEADQLLGDAPRDEAQAGAGRASAIEAESLTPILNALIEAGLTRDRSTWPQSFDLVWQALPKKYRADAAADGPGEQEPSARTDPRYWRALLDASLPDPDAPATLADVLADMFARLEPDPVARFDLLRLVVTRLSYAVGTGQPATRQTTLAATEEVLRRVAQQAERGQEVSPDTDTSAPEGRKSEPVRTDVAGLVLLHPYLRLLFERLDVLDEDRKLPKAARSRAFSILQAITLSDGPPDPLHYVLLGLEGRPTLDTEELEPEATTLITGLLKAVIEQWGKLGKTSPDGLRETFLIRPGTVEIRDDGAHLTVAPGPFDVLLDALPWALSPVALPWMPAPCHVNWRSEDG